MRRRGSLVAVLVAVGAVLVPTSAHAIPAFARKYGVACSACHTNWPRLNRFGINFRDNGYRMNRERDNPVTQARGTARSPSAPPSATSTAPDAAVPVEPTTQQPERPGHHPTGTFGFLAWTSSPPGRWASRSASCWSWTPQLASASFNSTMRSRVATSSRPGSVFTRLFGTPYLNVRVGKGALHGPPHRPAPQLPADPGLPNLSSSRRQGARSPYAPGDNHGGVEVYGHSELSNFRYSVPLPNWTRTAAPFWSANVVSNPIVWAHVQYFHLTGDDFLASIEPGIFGAIGWQPTRLRSQAGSAAPCHPEDGATASPGPATRWPTTTASAASSTSSSSAPSTRSPWTGW